MGAAKRTLCIPLLGKGATNHLHRREVVEAFKKHGVEILFLVRDDYVEWVEKIPGCYYVPYRIPSYSSIVGRLLDLCVSLRYQYPSSDPWRKWRYETLKGMMPKFRQRLLPFIFFQLCRYRGFIQIVAAFEGFLYKINKFSDLDQLKIDQVLMLGVGTWADNLGSRITWWALKKRVPIVHFVGNYDSLCSKGFRGHPVDRLLVWGNRMRLDAIDLQGVSEEKIREIGPLRYNFISEPTEDRKSFFKKKGLDPSAATIVFAGSAHEFHYFEMLSVFEELKKTASQKLQLIVRVYPNKTFMQSAFFQVLQCYIEALPDVWLSRADKNVHAGSSDQEVLQIEEDDLWHLLRYSDVVVNIFSTITLEACMFDKPVINMWYFYQEPRALRQPIYFPYPLTAHIRRVMDSQATDIVYDREELKRQLLYALDHGDHRRLYRQKLVQDECGSLDGEALHRLVEVCNRTC